MTQSVKKGLYSLSTFPTLQAYNYNLLSEWSLAVLFAYSKLKQHHSDFKETLLLLRSHRHAPKAMAISPFLSDCIIYVLFAKVCIWCTIVEIRMGDFDDGQQW